MNQTLSSLLAIAQMIGGCLAFLAVAKSVEAIVEKQHRRRLFWLLPVAVVLWVFCVGLETRYVALLGVLILGSGVAAVVKRNKAKENIKKA